MRKILTILLLTLLAAAIYATVRGWPWLDATRLSGPVIIALLFFAITIFALHLDLAEALPAAAPPSAILAHFLTRLPRALILIIGFPGGAWLILLLIDALFASWLAPSAVEFIFLLAFLAYVAAIIKLFTHLADRDLL